MSDRSTNTGFLSRCKTNSIGFAILGIFLLASACSLSYYLNWQPVPLIRVFLFVSLFALARYAIAHGLLKPNTLQKHEIISLLIFSLLLSASVILGQHIIINSSYSGTMDDNYITPYSAIDLVALALNTFAIATFALSGYFLFKKRKNTPPPYRFKLTPLTIRWIAGLSLIFIGAWIPYLLAYWPGLIFSDSIKSFDQVFSLAEWSNHHPVAYTFLLKCCISLTGRIGISSTWGCALYCIVQIIIMALCFSWLSRWVVVRTGISPIWSIASTIIMAFCPYIASYSIAFWKDPFFSCAIVSLTLLLMDFALSRGKVIKSQRFWLPLFTFSLISMSLLRSNGTYIAGLITIIIICISIYEKTKIGTDSWLSVTARAATITVILSLCITGPIYSLIGISKASVAETLAIPLNQMARVAAIGGEMKPEDESFMNELLPLERYPSTYRPCCVDMLKWDSHFKKSAIDSTFFSHWLSMLLDNPRAFFEAWELQTCGFWSINQSAVLNNTINIAGGVPRNTSSEEFIYQDIITSNKFQNDRIRDFLPLDEWSIPLGLINWGVVYLTLCMFLLKRPLWTLGFTPLIGLVTSLLVSTPIYYWQRYEAAGHFLLPFYIAVIIMLSKKPDASLPDNSTS